MDKRTMDELISYFNQEVSKMDISKENKMKLLGMITAIGYENKKQEVVRCRECKWYSIYEAKKDGTPDKRYSPSVCLREIYAKRRDPDWFCADGERKVHG